MPLAELDLAALRRWVITARADLAAYAEDLNRLNVFPVPDGDTGSNLLMTMSDAVDEIDATAPEALDTAAAAMAGAMLTAARGNSGVILSQLARGVSEAVEAGGDRPLGPQDLAQVLTRASQLAQDGVSTPVPGTILTVAAAAGTAARAAGSTDLSGVVDAAVDAARDALLSTRTENPVLLSAGVVDAGGAGYLVVLEALQRVIHGEGGLASTSRQQPDWLLDSAAPDVCTSDGAQTSPAYEVMYLLDASSEGAVAGLKRALDALGDSLVVAGGPQRYSVHVHVDDVAAALNAGVTAGRPYRFRVTRFADQMASVAAEFVTLALASGDGISQALRQSGVDVVTDWRDAAVLRARLGGAGTLLLCSSPEAYDAAVALAAAGRVTVVGQDAAQLLAAVSVLPADRSTTAGFERACSAARGAAGEVISTRVVGAASQDVLVQRVREVIDAAQAPELVTLVTGSRLPVDRADDLVEETRASYPALEVIHLAGGDEGTILTIGVE